MKTKILIIIFLCIYASGSLLAQETVVTDNSAIAEKIGKKEHFDNFSVILQKFNDVTLPISSGAEQFTKAPMWLMGKFKIDANYIGLLVGGDEYSSLFIYDMKGNYSDDVLVWDYVDYYEFYDYYSVVEFNLSKDLILDITCSGDDCGGYPLKFKIISGKLVSQ